MRLTSPHAGGAGLHVLDAVSRGGSLGPGVRGDERGRSRTSTTERARRDPMLSCAPRPATAAVARRAPGDASALDHLGQHVLAWEGAGANTLLHYRLTAVAVISAVLGSGCWVGEAGVFDAVWSDDDEMLAIGVFHYEVRASQRNEGSDVHKRKTCKQVYMLPADRSLDPEPITGCESAGTDFYLMNAAEYLLVRWHFSDHTEIRRYTLDGEWTKMADSRDEPAIVPDGYVCDLNGIPSPAGAEIAITFQCQTIPTGDSRAHLRIIDGYSGTELLPRTDVPSVAGGIWTLDGDFLWGIQSINPDTVLRWSPGALDLDVVPTPSCIWPPTTSGRVSEDGMIVAPGESLDDPVRFGRHNYPGVPDEKLQPFGCP